jgi:hypothetical protein
MTIELSLYDSLPRKIPCSRLVMLGVDKKHQDQQRGFPLCF